MVSGAVIREYKTTDREELVRLLCLNIPTFFAPAEQQDFEQYLDLKREMYFVFEYAGKIVGCGGINFVQERTIGKISWDVFHPDYQNMSLGTMLLQHRINILKSIPSIRQITVRTSQLAFGFYQKKGFRLVEVVKDYWAEGFDLYSMEYAS